MVVCELNTLNVLKGQPKTYFPNFCNRRSSAILLLSMILAMIFRTIPISHICNANYLRVPLSMCTNTHLEFNSSSDSEYFYE